MKRLFLLLVVILGCIFNAAGADAPREQRRPSEPTKSERDLEQFMVYYRSPAPEKIDGFLKALDAVQLNPQALAPILGFFYEVFRANPDRVPGWLETIKKFRNTKLKEHLQVLAVVAVPGMPRPPELASEKLPTPEEFDRESADIPDFCWGRFFATGDAKHVDTVLRHALTAKDRKDAIDLLAYSARWSLFALSRQQPEVEKIFRDLLTKCSDDDVKFLFAGVKVPERERLLGKERAAKLPPPVEEKPIRKTQARKSPFKGLFQEWKNRPNPNDEGKIFADRYVAELVKMYPASSPADIRKFVVWFCLGGVKDHAAGMKKAPCADPWAEAVRVSQLYASVSGPAAKDTADKANKELIARLPSGDLLRVELLYLAHNAAKPDSEEKKQLEREFVAGIEAVVLKGGHRNAGFYQRLYNLLSNSNSCGRSYWIDLETKLKPHAEKIDPWFWEMVQGRSGIAAAWAGRGSGWASTVTDEGWKAFNGNLDKARRHLRRAIELFPDRYNAHIRLITVEMGSGSVEARIEVFKQIAWYNAANEAAWDNILWALQPRWGGSFELIRMLAVAAMECPRRDVGVAEMGYQALADIAKYSDMRWQNVYRDPEVRKLADRLFSEYEKRMTTPEERHTFLWRRFCREMALGEYDAAAATFREYGGAECAAKEKNWQWGAWYKSKIGTPMYDDPVMRLKVFTGRHAATIREAEKLFLSGDDYRAALEKLAGVIRDSALPPDEKEFLIDLYGRWRLNCAPEDLCLQDGKYMSAYLAALRQGRSDAAAEMAKLGYRQQEKHPGEIVFGIVAEGDNTGEILRRHAAGENIDVVREEDGYSPLHLAARNGRTEMVETLLKCGAKIDRRNRNGHTPLHLAATMRRGPAVRVLFKYGADPNEQDNEGDFCLLYLPQVHALSGMYKLFLEHPKINVNLQNHAGETALHYMAKFGTPVGILKLMTDAGADCSVRDGGGRTALDVAEANGNSEAAEFLRSVGAKRGSELPPLPSPEKVPAGKWWSELPLEYWYAAGAGVVLVLLVVLAVLTARRGRKGSK